MITGTMRGGKSVYGICLSKYLLKQILYMLIAYIIFKTFENLSRQFEAIQSINQSRSVGLCLQKKTKKIGNVKII